MIIGALSIASGVILILITRTKLAHKDRMNALDQPIDLSHYYPYGEHTKNMPKSALKPKRDEHTAGKKHPRFPGEYLSILDF